MGKRVVFIADSLDNAYKFHQVLSQFDVETAAGSTIQIKKLLASDAALDLIVFEARGTAKEYMDEVRVLAESLSCALLVIVNADEADILPVTASVRWDFVVHGASQAECSARVGLLLDEGAASEESDIITVDTMTINLATYQVLVGGEPVDFTYLEYALLAFLVRHPCRTFSRDVLLQHVWGFDYYGGSRTVDVHVRRVRAKLGPELAQHLETVRGVGYLWNS